MVRIENKQEITLDNLYQNGISFFTNNKNDFKIVCYKNQMGVYIYELYIYENGYKWFNAYKSVDTLLNKIL